VKRRSVCVQMLTWTCCLYYCVHMMWIKSCVLLTCRWRAIWSCLTEHLAHRQVQTDWYILLWHYVRSACLLLCHLHLVLTLSASSIVISSDPVVLHPAVSAYDITAEKNTKIIYFLSCLLLGLVSVGTCSQSWVGTVQYIFRFHRWW